MKKIRPPFKCHGGKYYLCKWILGHLPEDYANCTYVEPFSGAASVLVNKEKSKLEILNDLDEKTIQIFRALRDEPKEFIRRLNIIKYRKESFDRFQKKSKIESDDYLDQAVTEFALRRMSRGGLKKNFSWSNRQRGGQPGDVNAWQTAIELLPVIAERIRGIHIFNKPAIEIIKVFNDHDTVFYIDPPYLHSTRSSTSTYSHEMATEDHVELANLLTASKGKVIISGYSSPLYKTLYTGWKCERKKVPNHASQQKTKKIKTECIWKNF